MNNCVTWFPGRVRCAKSAGRGFLALFVPTIAWSAGIARAADVSVAFTGEKTDWHGFDRYDFLMDEQDLGVNPAAAGADSRGQRRCTVVVPREVAPGRPWSWRGCYWDHQPQTEIDLLGRGF